MPVYMFPDLLQGRTPELKEHVQGKSCSALFAELALLTRLAAERAQKEA